MPSHSPSPLTLLAFALVAAGVVGTLWSRRPAPTEAGACTGPACPAATGGAEKLPTPVPSPRPVLDAEQACRNVAYLCAGLAPGDRRQIRRWKDFEGTMVVHVPRPEVGDAGVALRLQRAASAGIRLWHQQPFPIVVDERGTREAHFAVRWSRSLGGGQIGLARTAWSPQTGQRVLSLELATHNPYTGRPMDPREMRLVAAHEMGHALGLPHSDEPRDVMYPTNTAAVLSARDYRTLEVIYEMEDGTEIVAGPGR